MENSLLFNPDLFTIDTCQLDDEIVTYRAYKNIPYCKYPVDPIQVLNIFVPSNVNADTPIFMPTTVGGYMAGPADEPGKNYLGIINATFHAIKHGYVVVAPGIRGHNSFINGKSTGKAPAFVVDMKAAIRYIKFNKNVFPGNSDKIIVNGTSAGGALAALTAASGNHPDFEYYLKKLGAAPATDDIFAASCYCPIHNLEHADTAYEWQFNKEHVAHMLLFKEMDDKLEITPIEYSFTDMDIQLSDELKKQFPDYINQLELKDQNNKLLTLNQDGNGPFKDYVLSFIKASAQKELNEKKWHTLHPMLQAPNSDIHSIKALTIKSNQIVDVDWDGYISQITRMKKVPAFDQLELTSPENKVFGDDQITARHFTPFGYKHSKTGGTLANKNLIQMMNPLNYIGNADTAKYWRIRHGSFDRDTSLAIPVILATYLQNKGFNVDFYLPWGLIHSGDYDLEELFTWIDEICLEEENE